MVRLRDPERGTCFELITIDLPLSLNQQRYGLTAVFVLWNGPDRRVELGFWA